MIRVHRGHWSGGRRLMMLGLAASAVVTFCICTVSVVMADINAYQGQFGSVVLSGFVEAEADIHTAQRNPNNVDQPGNPEIQLAQVWGLVDTTWHTPIEGLKFYARTRLFLNQTANLDPGNIRHYDAFPQRWAGDGIAFMQLANDNVSLQAWEEWVQYENATWFIRLGKQTIVWGDVAPTRLLDEVNPLDLSWHFVNEPLGRDVFDNLRIPIWALRVGYSPSFFPTGWEIEGYISPDIFAYMDTQLPANNSPYNLLSFPPPIQFHDNINSGRYGVSGGVRLTGMLGPVNFTVAWLDRHDPDFIPVVTKVVGNFIPPSTFIPTLIQIEGQHPRFETVGASFNYFNDLTGVVARGEGVWDFARPFQNPKYPTSTLRRDRWGYALAFDRPTFFTEYQHHSTSLTLQFEQLWFEGGAQPVEVGNQVITSRHQEAITFLFEQPFEGFNWHGWDGVYDEWYLDFSMIASLQNAAVVSPMVRYEPGDHWRYAVWYNWYMGPYEVPTVDATIGGFGAFTWSNGVNISVSYQF